MPEIADDYPPLGESITANQSALASGGARHFFFFPYAWPSELLTVTRTVGCEGSGEGLTQGEEEGIEADLFAVWNLGDEPLSYAADGD